MNIADVLNVVGNQPLAAFPWAAEVLETVNAYVPASNKLSINDTGLALVGAVEKLSPEIKAHLLERVVEASLVHVAEQHAQAIGQEFPVGYIKSYRPIITAILALLLMITAGLMAVGENAKASHAHGVANHEWSEKFLRAGMDLLKIALDEETSTDTAQKAPQQPPVAPPSGGAASVPAGSTSAPSAPAVDFQH